MKFVFPFVILLISITSLFAQNSRGKLSGKNVGDKTVANSLIVNGDFSQDETGFTLQRAGWTYGE